ncbi:hypothetical protein GCM10011376_31680 [Nocardioides flavus (ex Wang et al. 2016)]|uniref:Uncharacterized protein n=1 Tax=Nocardioides flavus (ex Wang et al. 2016) TaxID=2058780 RepID=A0ABQ3HNU4_9ACTN|nr:hypothetical protein [Nocardioides flavus (ex Wang et al. 2016)]GHE18558.1 hypothetical protein GCM10011376_31680 [Nocardioides flavus (ex Wang et al. 2016)]
MTTHVSLHVSPSRSSRSAYARWAGRAVVLAGAPALALLAAPAHADVPAGWGGQTEHQGLEALDALALFVGAPLLLFVVIGLAVYIPAMIRGEKLLPDHSAGEAQWIGGPRQGVAELPAPDGEDSRAGGASGSW